MKKKNCCEKKFLAMGISHIAMKYHPWILGTKKNIPRVYSTLCFLFVVNFLHTTHFILLITFYILLAVEFSCKPHSIVTL